MANGIYFMVINLFFKFITIWMILSIISMSLWVVVRTTQKYRAKAKILWAIGLGSESVDEIVAKTNLNKEGVEDLLQELVEDKVIEVDGPDIRRVV